MKSRNGFSKTGRLTFDTVSIPYRVSSQFFGRSVNQSTDSNKSEAEYYLGALVSVEGESPIPELYQSPGSTCTMETGLGVIAEVESTVLCIENPNYPAEKRFIGVLETTTGMRVGFVSDIGVPVEDRGWRAVGRLKRSGTGCFLEIADHTRRGPNVAS